MVISKSQITLGEKHLILISIKLFFLADQNPQGKDCTAFLDGINLCFCVLSRSVMSNSATPWAVARQASLSIGILQARIPK